MVASPSNPAVHEAGHVVVGKAFRLSFSQACIEGDGGVTHWCALPPTKKDELILYVAGSVAEELFGSSPGRKPLVSQMLAEKNHPDYSVEGSDVQRVSALAAWISQQEQLDQQEQRDFIKELVGCAEEEARGILRNRQEYVLVIACTFDTKRCLTEMDVPALPGTAP